LLTRLAPGCRQLHGVHLTILLCLQDNQNETAQCLVKILGRGRKEDRDGEGRGAGVRRRESRRRWRVKGMEKKGRGREGRGRGDEKLRGIFMA